MNRRISWLLLIGGSSALLLLALAWLWRDQLLPMQPIRSRLGGYTDTESLNGFGVFGDLLRARGHQLSRTKLVSTQIDDFDLIIWTHEGPRLPSGPALDRLEKWMDSGGRLVFIGRGYDATSDFWEDVYTSTVGAEREAARWLFRQHQVERFGDQPVEWLFADVTAEGQYADTESNAWFQAVHRLTSSPGRWRAEAGDDEWQAENATARSYWIRDWLTPNIPSTVVASIETPDYTFPAIWRSESSGRQAGPTDLWVISAPRFLTNYGILRAEDAPIRDQFLSEIQGYQRVLFLETGPGPVRVSNTPDSRLDRPWAWMSQPPFPLFVLQAIALAVFFCFARFPVFGRPSIVVFRPRNDFGQHLTEIGRLLRSKGEVAYARQRVAHYFQVVRKRQQRTRPEPTESEK